MKYLLFSIFLLAHISSSFSQTEKSEADNFYQSGDYQKAIPLYLKYIKKNDSDSLILYKLGMSYGNIADYKKSLEFLQEAIDGNFYPGFTYGQKARFSAMMGDAKSLYLNLDSLLKYNPGSFALIEKDSVFNQYSTDSKFLNCLKQMKIKSYPCLTNEKSRLFDFWIGEWNVIASGRKAGLNVITRANGGCAIHESYTTSGAYTGQSINFLDPEDNLWKQYWVGSSGDVYSFSEVESEKGKIVFIAKSKASEIETWTRLSFTHDQAKDEVTQLFESSTNSGKSWKSGFNGVYQKINNK